MKKLLLLVSALAALSLLAPSSSYAVQYMGLYFDNGVNPNTDGLSCTTGGFATHKTAYIVYLNPVETLTRGFECQIEITSPTIAPEAIQTLITVTYPAQATDVGLKDAPLYNFITGYATGQPITGLSFVFGTLDIFILDNGQLNFFLNPASPPSIPGSPVVMRDDFSLFSVDVTQDTGVSSPTMILNPTSGDCTGVTLPSEDISWGTVKSLFR